MASLEYYRYAKIVLSLIAFVVIWQLACFIFKILHICCPRQAISPSASMRSVDCISAIAR